LVIEELQAGDAPADIPKWNIASRIERFIALCCIALLLLLAIKNLIVGYYVLAGFISGLMAMVFIDVLSSMRGRWLPVPVPAVLIVLAATILATIWYCGPQGALWAFPAIVGGILIDPRKSGISLSVFLIVAVPTLVTWQSETALAIRLLLSLSLTTAYMWFSVSKTQELQDKLMSASTLDPLTGSYNRRYLEWTARQVNGQRVGVMLIDIDHFKDVNDSLGHAGGDLVLREITFLMNDLIGSKGNLFRIGGEEFLVLIGQPKDSLTLARNIRSRICEASILPDRTITVSIGVVQKGRGETLQNAQHRADKQLYSAKQQGRNRVCSD